MIHPLVILIIQHYIDFTTSQHSTSTGSAALQSLVLSGSLDSLNLHAMTVVCSGHAVN
jgi:hypothetical protein